MADQERRGLERAKTEFAIGISNNVAGPLDAAATALKKKRGQRPEEQFIAPPDRKRMQEQGEVAQESREHVTATIARQYDQK
ncbi:hypothetical protein N7541_001784 [Penicillium brevicompactum]|uniref:Uncharacterized protein n=1 Tax=Penicillium brevicompactum TaxID=5074 RepID=A0A9W9S1J4_PENBR|nr:hypothetical protein N7541_001784 [Penicillium brevicompactum]